tara:strand:+ start:1767 stop:2093 length:327 start_codon:yes stop_codon:yes gene_type:complete
MFKDKYMIKTLEKKWEGRDMRESIYLGYAGQGFPFCEGNYLYITSSNVEEVINYIIENKTKTDTCKMLYRHINKRCSRYLFETVYEQRLGEFNEMVNKMDDNVTESNS